MPHATNPSSQTQTSRKNPNFAKMDRIVHPEIEKFKAAVMNMQVHGLTVEEWRTLLASKDEQAICDVLASRLDIKEQAAKALVK